MASKTPGGILIFFPSYKLMTDIYEKWISTGSLREITDHK